MRIDKKKIYISVCVAVLLAGIALGIYFLIHNKEPAYTETSWVTEEEGYRCRTADDVCVVTENAYSYYPSHLNSRSSCIYCLRIMDENDPLNSVILYYDAYTGALLEGESLSD